MKNTISQSSRSNSLSEEQKEMLREVMDKVKDVPAFLEKKEAIRNCIDVEKSKQGELIVVSD